MHQWFVKQGRIGIARDEDLIDFDVDPEGHDHCLLTALDAKEIAEILTGVAHEIWESQTERPPYRQGYEETSAGRYQWQNSANAVTLGVASDHSAIEVALEGASPFKMNVNQAVELIQIIQRHLSSGSP